MTATLEALRLTPLLFELPEDLQLGEDDRLLDGGSGGKTLERGGHGGAPRIGVGPVVTDYDAKMRRRGAVNVHGPATVGARGYPPNGRLLTAVTRLMGHDQPRLRLALLIHR
jgi:hypothetical protein